MSKSLPDLFGHKDDTVPHYAQQTEEGRNTMDDLEMQSSDLATAVVRVRACIPELDLIEDSSLRGSIERIWARAWRNSAWPDLLDCGFSPDAPSYRLVDHVRAVAQGCLAIADIGATLQGIHLDRQRILALALLHDVSKLLETEPDDLKGTRTSELGNLIQHGVLTAHLALEEQLSLDLVHLILTHTPHSKMEPHFLEGIVHYHVDLANAGVILFPAVHRG